MYVAHKIVQKEGGKKERGRGGEEGKDNNVQCPKAVETLARSVRRTENLKAI